MRAGIYNRCSTEEEAQINALAIQAAESRERVTDKGWEIADQYIESESGTTTGKRAEYQRLLEDMETDKFDIIVIKSIDRLMRSAKDWYIFLDKLVRYHKRLYIYIDNKFYTPDDSLLTGIKAILAEDFSRELSKKIKNAHRRRQEKRTGLNITQPMFGWNKTGMDVYEINEEEAAAYRLAFVLAMEGKGFHTIAKIMYGNGVRSKRGTGISDVQWRKMLYSPRAHGTVVLHTTEYDFEAKKRIRLPENEWIYVKNALPPIVSEAYQRQVLEAIAARTSKNSFRDYTRDMTAVGLYEFSGKLYCAECGEVYYRTSFASGKYTLTEWKCSTAIKYGRKTRENPDGCNNINVIEEAVLENIEEACKEHYAALFGCPDRTAEELLAAIRKVISRNDGTQELDKLERELKKQERKKKVLMSKLMDEVICDEDFKAVNREVSGKIEQLLNRINDIKCLEREYNGCEERLRKIKRALVEGMIDRAGTKLLISGMKKIMVHSDGMLEITFDKFPETKTIPYEHKNNIVRKREKINREILEIFKNNPGFMLKEVYPLLNASESYINASVKQLKEKGMLRYERNGNTHTGSWIVREPIDNR